LERIAAADVSIRLKLDAFEFSAKGDVL
jgi:hypothetical protein